MQGYVSPQPGWLTNLLSRRTPGLFDPGEFGTNRTPNAPDLLEASPWGGDYPATRDGSHALIQRMLDDAVNRRPPMGLFDPRDSDLPQEPTPSGFRALSPQTPDIQLGYPTTIPDSSDAVVRRLLDQAANSRAPIGLFNPATSEPPRVETSPQPLQDRPEWPSTPTVAGVIAGAGIGGNLPTIPKGDVRPKTSRTMGSRIPMTSPNSVLARSLPFAEKPLPIAGLQIPSINYRGGTAWSGNWGSALGRTAGPVGGALALTYDLYNSDNKLRTAIADGFGMLGSAIGGTVGAGGGPAGISAGLVGGGYAGNLVGGSLYDLGAYAYAHPEIYGDPTFLATY